VTIRIFLVEDMKQVQGVLADLLSSVGDFRITHAVATEAEAKHWLVENPQGWDLVVIDLVLEQGSGMGVIPRARDVADRNGASVVVFSDYASEGIQNHCRRLGADAVFLKSQVRDLMDFCSELSGRSAVGTA
jgi:DNA-binding NarL/FixJ family response regulator